MDDDFCTQLLYNDCVFAERGQCGLRILPRQVWPRLHRRHGNGDIAVDVEVAALLAVSQENEIPRRDQTTAIRTRRLVNDVRILIDIL